MQKLESPDTHHLSAAIGWLELGNLAEAKAELNSIDPARQSHPDVLEVRWLICAEDQNWIAGLEAARALVRQAPQRCSGWLHQAYALRRIPEGMSSRPGKLCCRLSINFPRNPLFATTFLVTPVRCNNSKRRAPGSNGRCLSGAKNE